MSASINDIGIKIVSNGEIAYYSSYKGIGNILWEIDFGLYSNEKPDAFNIFEFTRNTLWDDSVNSLDEPLINPIYGLLSIDFDNKTILDENEYGSWNNMPLDWLVNCIFKFSNREMKGWNSQTILTKKSFIKHLKAGNFFIVNRFQKKIDLILPNNINDAYDLFVSLGYDDNNNRPVSVIKKDYTWAQIKLPEGWRVLS